VEVTAISAVAAGCRCSIEVCPRTGRVASGRFSLAGSYFGVLCEAEQVSVLHALALASIVLERQKREPPTEGSLSSPHSAVVDVAASTTRILFSGRVPLTQYHGPGKYGQIWLRSGSSDGHLSEPR